MVIEGRAKDREVMQRIDEDYCMLYLHSFNFLILTMDVFLRKQTRPRTADPMRQPPTLVLLLSDNIMNRYLSRMDVEVREGDACSDVSKEFYESDGGVEIGDE